MGQNYLMKKPSPHFQFILKPVGALCNMRCDYCYYLDKRELYPNSVFRMPEDVLRVFTREYIEACPSQEVVFAWQGGEPTLAGIDFFELAIAYQERFAPSGKRVRNALQTNGTQIDDRWCAFLRQHDVLVGLSLDGPRYLHDAHRKSARGGSTFDQTLRALRLLQAHEIEFNILTTVNASNVERPLEVYRFLRPLEVYRFLRDDLGVRFMQFIPIVTRGETSGEEGQPQLSHESVSGKAYGRFLIEIFDEWIRRDVGKVFVQAFDLALGAWLGAPSALCVFQPTCGGALVLEHNGDVYSCDHFVDPNHHLGNILDRPLIDMVNSRQQISFGQAKLAKLPGACRHCRVRFACNGGCPKNRFFVSSEGEAGLNALCDGYKRFFEYVEAPMQKMAKLLRQGKSPSLIIKEY